MAMKGNTHTSPSVVTATHTTASVSVYEDVARGPRAAQRMHF